MQLNLDIESFFSFLFLLKDAGSSFSFQYKKKKKKRNGGRLIADQNSPPVNAAHSFSDKKNETPITG